mgnify:CR=1 FL=1
MTENRFVPIISRLAIIVFIVAHVISLALVYSIVHSFPSAGFFIFAIFLPLLLISMAAISKVNRTVGIVLASLSLVYQVVYYVLDSRLTGIPLVNYFIPDSFQYWQNVLFIVLLDVAVFVAPVLAIIGSLNSESNSVIDELPNEVLL